MKSTQQKLAVLTVFFILVVIGLGAFTRLADAGLGCPDWPGCYGFVGIPLKEATIAKANMAFPEQPYELHKAWPEMVHRYFAGTLGLLILALFIIAFRRRNETHATVKLSAGLLVMVTFQAALGAWTVTEKLHPAVVMGHLLGGFTTFSLLIILTLRLFRPQLDFAQAKLPAPTAWLNLAIGLVVAQIALGGWTSAHYAALACRDLPVCFAGWYEYSDFIEGFKLWGHEAETYQYGVITNEARVAVHATHRIGAMVVTGALGLLFWQLWLRRVSLAYRKFLIGLAVLLIVQICLGVVNVTMGLPLFNAVAHNLVGSLLLITLIALRVLIAINHNDQKDNA
ncbi:MAG: COX15/CtaA family protein [Gammaproteobacteria bacterium]|nr:COX15/CtaA family protein [Gammaproteobacteria bacterium]